MTFLPSPRILILVVLGVLLIPSCENYGDLLDRFDVHIKNCSMDNIRILGPGTNMHVDRDEDCNENNKEYMASFDTNVTGKLFSLERSVGGCQALLDIELTDRATTSLGQDPDHVDDCMRDMNITLREPSSGVFAAECSEPDCLKVVILDCSE